ncbi:hypothetical protein B0H16DRAFT_1617563 [Mycena metata]|uniref:Uncharacterized protein n=1 Tax=Mycena metata TaxID=1033252 RepID=A0AAD7H984_9AGAR|nr:hypothetical protein B0H16DRAFT_1617563 [Mycena metata]
MCVRGGDGRESAVESGRGDRGGVGRGTRSYVGTAVYGTRGRGVREGTVLYESTPRGIDTEGHVAAVAHCPVGVDVDAERVGLRPGVQPKLDVVHVLYRGEKISVGVVHTGGRRGRV